ASCPSSEAHRPSSPWRCSEVASASKRRVSTMSRYSPRRSSAVMSATYGSNSAFLTRLPSGVSSWTRAGSALSAAPAAFLAVVAFLAAPVGFLAVAPLLVPVAPALFPALRRGVRGAVLSTVTCAPPSVRPPGLPGDLGVLPAHGAGKAHLFSATGHGVGATRPGTGVTGAPASALQCARYPVRHISVKPHLTWDFAWISK